MEQGDDGFKHSKRKQYEKLCPSCGEHEVEDEQCKFCGYSVWTEGLTTEELNERFQT